MGRTIDLLRPYFWRNMFCVAPITTKVRRDQRLLLDDENVTLRNQWQARLALNQGDQY